MTTSALETELVEASSFEPTKNYERQDYLAALARAINEVDEEVFDDLSVEAQDWFNLAVKAINKKQEIPDFPDAEEADDEDEAPPDEPADEPADEEEAEGEEASDDEDEAPPPKAAKKPAKPAKAAKSAKAKPADDDDDEPEAKPAKKTPKRLPTPGENKDRYGITIGSQGHKAILMLEQGNRMSVVTEDVGGTYYNLLKKLTQDGHKIEKSPTGIIKLTHKDDVKKIKPKK